jgi:transglutaminase-like putative cysteine protease
VSDIFYNDIASKADKTIHDRSNINVFSVYEDNRVKYTNISNHDYPFIIEYSYDIDIDEFFNSIIWTPQSSSKTKVNKAELIVTYPVSQKLKFKMYNFENQPEITIEKGFSRLRFALDSIPVYQNEIVSPPFWEQTPTVFIVSKDFKYHGYTGSFESWKSYGEWVSSLNINRDVLPDELKNKVKLLTENCKDTVEMIRNIYQYMQDNTRYVSIQYGIGGFQPETATDVVESGYGDCKALSNFTVSMLKEAGIKANYTLVRAGRNTIPIIPDFPISLFNHVIVNVPLQNDTVWLECTNQQSPFNYLGSFTSDRYVLSVDGEHSTLVKTPDYDSKTNRVLNTASIKIDENGNANTIFVLDASGIEYEKYRFLLIEDHDEQEKWIIENMDIKSFDLESFDVSKDYSGLPKMDLQLQLSINKYASVSGKRMFIPLKIYDPLEDIPKVDEERINDIFLQYSYIEIDSIVFQIPLGYNFEYLPKPVIKETQFGAFEMKVIQEDNFITYYRKLKVNKGRFPASDFQAFVEFYKLVQKADKQQVVLSK